MKGKEEDGRGTATECGRCTRDKREKIHRGRGVRERIEREREREGSRR
jgi:hypothetical protein